MKDVVASLVLMMSLLGSCGVVTLTLAISDLDSASLRSLHKDITLAPLWLKSSCQDHFSLICT